MLREFDRLSRFAAFVSSAIGAALIGVSLWMSWQAVAVFGVGGVLLVVCIALGAAKPIEAERRSDL